MKTVFLIFFQICHNQIFYFLTFPLKMFDTESTDHCTLQLSWIFFKLSKECLMTITSLCKYLVRVMQNNWLLGKRKVKVRKHRKWFKRCDFKGRFFLNCFLAVFQEQEKEKETKKKCVLSKNGSKLMQLQTIIKKYRSRLELSEWKHH